MNKVILHQSRFVTKQVMKNVLKKIIYRLQKQIMENYSGPEHVRNLKCFSRGVEINIAKKKIPKNNLSHTHAHTHMYVCNMI